MRRQTVRAAAAAMLACTLLGTAACAPRFFRPPEGPGDPAPDAPAAWAEATAACRSVQTYSALVTLSGNIEGQGFPGISVNTALTADGAAYLNAQHSGGQIFLLAGRAERAWLWLREEHRVVEAPLAEIVDALAALRLGGADLLAMLTGCGVRDIEIAAARRYGDRLAVETGGGRVFLAQRSGAWTTIAAVREQVTVDYGDRTAGWPADVRIDTADRRPSRVRLRFRIEQVVAGEPLAPQLFERPAGAADAAPMTIDELRASGPLRRGG